MEEVMTTYRRTKDNAIFTEDTIDAAVDNMVEMDDIWAAMGAFDAETLFCHLDEGMQDVICELARRNVLATRFVREDTSAAD
jgi:hypothetical protein